MEPQDERAILLEEEDVLGVLLVDVAADDPEGVLIVAGARQRIMSALAAMDDRLVHEPGDVLVGEGHRLLLDLAHRFRPGARSPTDVGEGLDDEPVRGLHHEDVLHGPLVQVGADRPEDLLEVLPGTAVVDPHRALPGRLLRSRPRWCDRAGATSLPRPSGCDALASRSSGRTGWSLRPPVSRPGEWPARGGERRPRGEKRQKIGAAARLRQPALATPLARRTAIWPATRASLMMSAVL